MKVCCEPNCRFDCYPKQKYCKMHWKRQQRLKEWRRNIPKPGPRKAGRFDLATLGAVGWRVRS